MSEMKKSELKGSLERIGRIVDSGLAPAPMARMYNRIMDLARDWNCDPWRLNGLFLDISESLTDVNVEFNKDYWFEADYIHALLDKWGLDRDMARDIFPFFAELDGED